MTPEQETIRLLSDRIVKAQAPIRVLDAIKWDESVKADFFSNKCEKQPPVDELYYAKSPLTFKPEDKIAEFHSIVRDAKKQLGEFSTITRLMTKRCDDYCHAVEMLRARGTPLFSELSKQLYGSASDVFYPGGPRLSELGDLLGDILQPLSRDVVTDFDVKQYSAEEARPLLQKKLSQFFSKSDQVKVTIDDAMVADAAAGADNIRLNPNVNFSERDLRYLEVHEGWVHIGTTINGSNQPYCTFLSKGTPACTVTQEGLAVITEVFSFSSYPSRMLKITNRVKAIAMVNDGANFVDIYRFFREQGRSDQDSYSYSSRVFRGSAPGYGPFTKDLSYSKGFILIYNYIRLAVQRNLLDHIPVFFVGKLLIEEIHDFLELMKEGLVVPPVYVPPQFSDLSALTAWMCFSLYLNKFDLPKVEEAYKFMLRE